MLITHIGHAEFLIELEGGLRIVTDPYDASCGYPVRQLAADAVLVSHHHHDHDAVENVTGSPRVIGEAGEYTLEKDVKIKALEGFHDDARGAKRGKTLLFQLAAEGMRVVHLGDLGCLPDEKQTWALEKPDVLMIPVGGFFTIDAAQAFETVKKLQPKVIIPMHYKTEYIEDWPIERLDAFLKFFDAKDIRQGGDALRVTAGDLVCQPKVAVI